MYLASFAARLVPCGRIGWAGTPSETAKRCVRVSGEAAITAVTVWRDNGDGNEAGRQANV